jgi:GWxTD domain-containing protein
MIKSLALCLAVLLAASSPSQVESSASDNMQPYNFDALSFASSASSLSRIDVYVQVPYHQLAFLKKDEGYVASYEVTIDVLDSASTLLNEKLWTETVKAGTFDETVSSQGFSLVQRSFEVAPGAYTITVNIRDTEKKENRPLSRRLVVTDFTAPHFSLSDVMLLSRFSDTGGKRVIAPNVSPNVGQLPEAFHVFFEAYHHEVDDSVRFVAEIFDAKSVRVASTTDIQFVPRRRAQVIMKIRNDSLSLGDYKLFIRAYPHSAGGARNDSVLALTSRAITVRWRGLPTSLKDIDLAIDECIYIAKDSEMEYMRAAKTPEEKQKRLLEFWKKRDPNPNTPRNEKMESYYARVEYANRAFKHYIEGWRTDMGMVYIIFGPPSSVDRHPFDVDAKPYEVWSYYELNHQFVFIDDSGFGDYRLTEPIWNVWQRPRD